MTYSVSRGVYAGTNVAARRRDPKARPSVNRDEKILAAYPPILENETVLEWHERVHPSHEAFSVMLDQRLMGALAKRIGERAREVPTPVPTPAQTPEQKQAEADEAAARLMGVPKGTPIV